MHTRAELRPPPDLSALPRDEAERARPQLYRPDELHWKIAAAAD